MFKNLNIRNNINYYLFNFFLRKNFFKNYSENISRKFINQLSSEKYDENFFNGLQNNFIEIQNFYSEVNSLAGWVPYFRKRTKIYLYNFLSINYSIRKPLIARLTLVKNQNHYLQKSFIIPINYHGELDVDKIFKTDDNFNSIIVEIFSPHIKKNHGGHDGHLRFFGKYYSTTDELNCVVHSMPITKMSSITSKNSKNGRTYLIKEFKENKFYNCYPCGKKVLENIDLTNYGYTVVLSPKDEILSVYHQSMLPTYKLDEKYSASYIPNRKYESLDPYIYIDEFENNFHLKNLNFFIIKNNKIIEKKTLNIEKGSLLMRESEIFGKKISGDHLLCLSIKSYGNGFFHTHYLGSNGQLSDQVHSNVINWTTNNEIIFPIETTEKRSNCRKFCTFELKDGSENFAILFLNKIYKNSSKEIIIRLFINNKEYVDTLNITTNEPMFILDINKIVFKYSGKNQGKGIFQIESYENNYPAVYFHKNMSGNICTDHFTGG